MEWNGKRLGKPKIRRANLIGIKILLQILSILNGIGRCTGGRLKKIPWLLPMVKALKI